MSRGTWKYDDIIVVHSVGTMLRELRKPHKKKTIFIWRDFSP